MASADGWTTFPAERQGAMIEMRAGQRGGPLPFEASFDSGERIINTKGTAKRWIRRTRDVNSGVFCNRVYVTPKSWKLFLDKENQEGGANNLVFEFRGNQTDAPDERARRNERGTHARINKHGSLKFHGGEDWGRGVQGACGAYSGCILPSLVVSSLSRPRSLLFASCCLLFWRVFVRSLREHAGFKEGSLRRLRSFILAIFASKDGRRS